MFPAQFSRQIHRAIRGTVAAQNHLIGHLQRIQEGQQPKGVFHQQVFFVVHRDKNGHSGTGYHGGGISRKRSFAKLAQILPGN